MPRTLSSLSQDLRSGRTTSVQLVRSVFERIEDPNGEGERVFLRTQKAAALAAADAIDKMRAVGLAPSPAAGIPISVKDLFDLAGEVTTAGSVVLRDAQPAIEDAPAIARLRRAGLIVVGRTNMSEFAFSGVGLNPHYGTPVSPFDRSLGRIPGGSSSGAAVSVSDEMSFAGIGSDTGGSCRIPAALCGIVGYKPTASSVPRQGAFPLSTSLDSIGPLANSVDCCRQLHGFMSGRLLPEGIAPLKNLRLAVPQAVALEAMDNHVAETFARALSKLSAAGAAITHVPMRAFETVAGINSKGGFAAAEAFAHHRQLIAESGNRYDPRVRQRILRGEQQSSADYIGLLQARDAFIASVESELAPFDAMIMPTVPTAAPAISELAESDEVFTRVNLLMLRNPSLINLMDGCSISLPMHQEGEAPAGLMISSIGSRDSDLFRIAEAVERAL